MMESCARAEMSQLPGDCDGAAPATAAPFCSCIANSDVSGSDLKHSHFSPVLCAVMR